MKVSTTMTNTEVEAMARGMSVVDKAFMVLTTSPMTEFTGEAMAAKIGHDNASTVQSALARGWESMTDGWEYIHRSERRRPAFYWCDPDCCRVPAAEETTTQVGNETCEVLFEQDGLLLMRRSDGRPYIARPIRLGDIVVQDTSDVG